MGVEYRLLGPLEALVDGRPVDLGAPRHRATLVLLLAQANAVVPAQRLIDDLWHDDPPASATNVVQGAVSHLRKLVGRDAIVTRGTGYAVRVGPDALDLSRFERLAEEGSLALEREDFDEAAAALSAALDLWAGPALADLTDEPSVQPVAARLEELRLLASERRLEAELGRGRHEDLLSDLRDLAREHPLRERVHELLIVALYRSGRQAEALEAHRSARTSLVEELGLEPGPGLQDLERRILHHDPALQAPSRNSGAPASAAERSTGSILVAPLDPDALDALIALAEPLARSPRRELIMVSTVSHGDRLAALSRELDARREVLLGRGVAARCAAFTSLTPGVDVARVAVEHAVDLLVIDAPDGLLEDARVLALLEHAPCDVAVAVGAGARSWTEGDVVLVPFGGASHDWAAVELGAWLARSTGAPLRLAGVTGNEKGRDASRLLASASLAVQHALGVSAEPVLVEPRADALIAAASKAGVVCVGLTERWRREGLGATRTTLATRVACPTLLVRRGVRPGGLAPRGSDTRFTWTLAGS